MAADIMQIGREILIAARNELFMNMPYLDLAFSALGIESGEDNTDSLATDGRYLYYDGHYLSEKYIRSPNRINRAFLHAVLHCMLRHLAKKKDKDGEIWDLACDIAVESIIDSLDYPCLKAPAAVMLRNKYYSLFETRMKVLTAEGIYRELLKNELEDHEINALRREFFADSHNMWISDSKSQQEGSDDQDKNWEKMSESLQSSIKNGMSDDASGGKAVFEQLKVLSRRGTDYREFLKKFSVPKEIMSVDGDSFDYIFYTYGLSLYGNLPLIEPQETREAKRIEDFVIAIDTSMSTSGDTVREFLSVTYSVLLSTETFLNRMNIHIIQCDDRIRSDVLIRNTDELKTYMEDFELIGQSSTDFRPVFEHIGKLLESGQMSKLRGLLYFTDGLGRYPEKRPPYETAFIIPDEGALDIKVPPWALKVSLTGEELNNARKGNI